MSQSPDEALAAWGRSLGPSGGCQNALRSFGRLFQISVHPLPEPVVRHVLLPVQQRPRRNRCQGDGPQIWASFQRTLEATSLDPNRFFKGFSSNKKTGRPCFVTGKSLGQPSLFDVEDLWETMSYALIYWLARVLLFWLMHRRRFSLGNWRGKRWREFLLNL